MQQDLKCLGITNLRKLRTCFLEATNKERKEDGKEEIQLQK